MLKWEEPAPAGPIVYTSTTVEGHRLVLFGMKGEWKFSWLSHFSSSKLESETLQGAKFEAEGLVRKFLLDALSDLAWFNDRQLEAVRQEAQDFAFVQANASGEKKWTVECRETYDGGKPEEGYGVLRGNKTSHGKIEAKAVDVLLFAAARNTTIASHCLSLAEEVKRLRCMVEAYSLDALGQVMVEPTLEKMEKDWCEKYLEGQVEIERLEKRSLAAEAQVEELKKLINQMHEEDENG